MKKGRFIILIMSVVFLVCSVVPSYAEQKSGWYSSEITLPRYLTTGQSYWLTKKKKSHCCQYWNRSSLSQIYRIF